MGFKMDEQSYRDLNIFGSGENVFSLFDLFKKTKTLGGRALVEHWMRNPSNAIDDLRKRTEAIAFFSKTNIGWFAAELNATHMDFKYMQHVMVDNKPKFTYQLKTGLQKMGQGCIL